MKSTDGTTIEPFTPPSPGVPVGRPAFCAHPDCHVSIRRGTGFYCAACIEVLSRVHQEERVSELRREVPEKYRECVFDSPQLRERVGNTQLLAKASKMLGKGFKQFYIWGGCGKGKTSIATAIYHQVLDAATERGTNQWRLASLAFWTDAPTLVAASRNLGIGKGGANDRSPEAMILRRATYASFLVLDELGLEQTTGATGSTIQDLVWSRSKAERPTVVTSSLSPEEVLARYDAGLHRRLVDPTFGAKTMAL